MPAEPDETTVVLKANEGDRAQNLLGIADAIDDLAQRMSFAGDAAKIRGYAEQLRIIADEIAPLYAVHWVTPFGNVHCAFDGTCPGAKTQVESLVTCKACLQYAWFLMFDNELYRRTRKNWHSTSGDWKQIDRWFAEGDGRTGPDVEALVTRYLAAQQA